MNSGFLNLNKPAQWTSHDCVARARRLLRTQKVGHGGTLDPTATGVLPIAVGKATKLIQYLPEQKAYRAVIRFGVTTTTDDLEGETLTQQTAQHLQVSEVEAHLPQFLGRIRQVPPMHSAIQVQGKRLYTLARQGKTIEIPTREVTIHQLVSNAWQAGAQPELTLDITCGPGTYIRALARDLGAAVGTGATLAALVRTHSSGFDLAGSITLEELEQSIAAETFALLPAEQAVKHLPAIALSPPLARRWCMGQKLPTTDPGMQAAHPPTMDLHTTTNGPLRVLAASTQQFLGIGEIRTNQIPSPVTDMATSATTPDNTTSATTISNLPHHILVAKRVFLTPAPYSASATMPLQT